MQVPSPLPVKADVKADEGLNSAPLPPISQTDVPRSGSRSGAMAPLPVTVTPKGACSPKPMSASPGGRLVTPPGVSWPMPMSRTGSRQGSRPGSRALSAGAGYSPQMRSPVAAHIPEEGEGELQALSPARSPIIWPTPKPLAEGC